MAADNTISFPGLLADAAMQIDAAGFTTKLWEPSFGWVMPEDEDAAEDPHPPQLLAAYQIFILFFVLRDRKKAWVHLGAEMQAGKTGVLAGLIRLILSNHKKLGIHPSNIFTITGMSDTAWKKQTKERLIGDVRGGVEHNARGGLDRIRDELYKIHSRGGLRNILVIVDESHIAAADSNGPNKIVFSTIERLCPRDKWVENNIHILTISATDPAKVMDITTAAEPDSAVVRLQTTPDYQSVEGLLAEGRIIPIQGDIHTEWATDAIRDIIFHEYDNEPLYHLLRPKATNYQRTIVALAREFPDATIIAWDGGNKGGAAGAGAGGSTTSDADINDILLEAPARTTFIILKNMLYAAKTLEDEHVGILYDRVGGKDDTNLQSLLGRACGYFKSKRTYVFTSQQTVDNYITCWKELCSKKGFPSTIKDIPKSRLNKKMSRVVARTRRGETQLYTDGRTPIAGGAAGGGSGTPPPARASADESLFSSEWREFDTMEEAKAWAPRIHEKQQDDYGFYLSSTTGAATVLTYDEVMGMKAGKKTANMPWKTLAPGAKVDRLYVAYTDIEDPNSAVFVVRRLTRNA